MRQIKREKSFIKDLDKARLNDNEFQRFIAYIAMLADEKPLPKESKDHALKGEYAKYREFHIGSDMLVVYKIEFETIFLARLGTHSQLFK